MYKIIFIWLFCLGILADIPLILIRLLDWIQWDWSIIIAVPFVLAIIGTVVYAILYFIIKVFVTLITLF